jgi:hypothetical protein
MKFFILQFGTYIMHDASTFYLEHIDEYVKAKTFERYIFPAFFSIH